MCVPYVLRYFGIQDRIYLSDSLPYVMGGIRVVLLRWDQSTEFSLERVEAAVMIGELQGIFGYGE